MSTIPRSNFTHQIGVSAMSTVHRSKITHTKEEETCQHLFYSCDLIKALWDSCSNLIDYVDLCNCTWQEILFGMNGPDKGKDQLLNHILILIKYLIFSCRERNSPPRYSEIKNKIVEDKWEEMILAKSRNTIPIHLSKWENFNM